MAVEWSSSDSATQLTSITTEQFFDDTPTLQPNQWAHVQVLVDFPGSPAEDAIVSIYASVDGTNYDTTPWQTAVVSRSIDQNRVSFRVEGVFKFRVGVKRSGSSMTITSADMAHKIATI